MATSTITIVDLEDGGVSLEIAHDVLPLGTKSEAQQIAVALRDRLYELVVAFDVPADQDAG